LFESVEARTRELAASLENLRTTRRKPLNPVIRCALFDNEIAALAIAKFGQPLAERTSRSPHGMSAFGGKADVTRTSCDVAF